MDSFPGALAAAAVLASAVPAAAHEDGLDARGVVVEVSATRIVLKTSGGETRRFVVTPGTEVRRGTAPARISDVAAGEKAVVHARRSPGGDAEAISIRLAKPAAARP
jgi:hypothetical protein